MADFDIKCERANTRSIAHSTYPSLSVSLLSFCSYRSIPAGLGCFTLLGSFIRAPLSFRVLIGNNSKMIPDAMLYARKYSGRNLISTWSFPTKCKKYHDYPLPAEYRSTSNRRVTTFIFNIYNPFPIPISIVAFLNFRIMLGAKVNFYLFKYCFIVACSTEDFLRITDRSYLYKFVKILHFKSHNLFGADRRFRQE